MKVRFDLEQNVQTLTDTPNIKGVALVALWGIYVLSGATRRTNTPSA